MYNYVVKNLKHILNLSVRELADEVHVSTATVMRFCKKMGYSGFSELKYKIKEFFAKKKKRIGFYDYDKCWKNILTDAKKAPRDTYLCGFVRYDDSPRRGNKARIILNESPEKFGEYMKKLMTISKKQNKEFVFLMAWNEWGEGAYLEPDTVDGNSYLEILKKVICHALWLERVLPMLFLNSHHQGFIIHLIKLGIF